ncbi:hypothetical protein T265_04872 [Opisthorchis viverrini]|uniref:Uncharacterized protein n=1 Tax=Opisthorchis viverrini TaxID=6198 RepID=A0A074ZLN9_OPIVI|nr:hypothetical protein T265_04872 [Opisthorchis viverrini]KER28273.1 hypothetical protein T265_04872 [Opisthorchis viverrini]
MGLLKSNDADGLELSVMRGDGNVFISSDLLEYTSGFYLHRHVEKRKCLPAGPQEQNTAAQSLSIHKTEEAFNGGPSQQMKHRGSVR